MLTIRGPDGRELPTIRTTDEHPFWVVDLDDFVPAGDLKPGDKFLGPDGSETTLAATEVEAHPEGVTVHNFEVEGAHGDVHQIGGRGAREIGDHLVAKKCPGGGAV